MRCLIIFLLLFLGRLLPAQDIFLSTLDGRLFSVDLSDCSTQGIADMPVSSTDISFHPNGRLYAISSTGRLFEIDPATGESTLIHAFETSASQLYTALTISAEGVFYASGLDGDLWRYDLATDTGAFLGNIGFGAEGDLTFYQGELYMASQNDNIVRVDITNPANSEIAINGNVPGRIFGIVSFAESCDSVSVYALTDNAASVYEVNFGAGTLDFFCTLPLQVSGGASTFEFLGSNPVIIDTIMTTGFSCAANDGRINIMASGGTGNLTYSLDGVDYQSESEFTNLAAMEYLIHVADEVGCIRTQPINPLGDLLSLTTLDLTQPTCGLENGAFTLEIAGGQLPFTLTVNGNSVSGLTLDNLPAGAYTYVLEDANACTLNGTFTLVDAGNPSINDLVVTPTSCGVDNGAVTLNATGGTLPYRYRLDGGPEQSAAAFTGLAPGTYALTVIDQSNCSTLETITIPPSMTPQIDTIMTTSARCGEANGRIEVGVVGAATARYRLDGGAATDSPIFSGLGVGDYLIEVTDTAGCTVSATASIGDTPPVALSITEQSLASCLQSDGTLSLQVAGGTGTLNLQQNGQPIPTNERLTNLAAGNYLYVATDELGCTDSLIAAIASGRCPLYFPNAFSPNFDGVNDSFGPQEVTGAGTLVIRFQVFDRWGGVVFQQENGLLTEDRFRWNGQGRGKDLPVGIYVYTLEVRYPDGGTDTFSGDVLLLR